MSPSEKLAQKSWEYNHVTMTNHTIKKWENPPNKVFCPFCKKFILSGWCHVYYNSRRENISFPSSRFWREGALDSCSWRNCFKVGWLVPTIFLMFTKERRLSVSISWKTWNSYMKTHVFAVIKSVQSKKVFEEDIFGNLKKTL